VPTKKIPKQVQERHPAGLLKSLEPIVNLLGNLIIHCLMPKAKQVWGYQTKRKAQPVNRNLQL